MKKMVWTPERYQEEFSRFLDEIAKQDPRPSSMVSNMGWAQKHEKAFRKLLSDNNIVWETYANDEYAQLRDTKAVQMFLAIDQDEITEGEFIQLAERSIEEAFGDISYLDSGYPRLLATTIKRKQDVLRRILNDRQIRVVLQRNRNRDVRG